MMSALAQEDDDPMPIPVLLYRRGALVPGAAPQLSYGVAHSAAFTSCPIEELVRAMLLGEAVQAAPRTPPFGSGRPFPTCSGHAPWLQGLRHRRCRTIEEPA